jgi:hypothetical protein
MQEIFTTNCCYAGPGWAWLGLAWLHIVGLVLADNRQTKLGRSFFVSVLKIDEHGMHGDVLLQIVDIIICIYIYIYM